MVAAKPQVPSAITRTPTPVDSVLTTFCDLVLAGDDELAQVAADAHVAVAGARLGGGGQRGVGQAFLETDVQRGLQLFGGDRLAEEGRQHQAAEAEAGDGQEVASVQGCSPSCRARARGAGRGLKRTIMARMRRIAMPPAIIAAGAGNVK